MNGIVTEAIYPRVSKDHEPHPVRVFYFDGTQSDLDRDVGIFLELAKTYKRRKKVPVPERKGGGEFGRARDAGWTMFAV